MASFAIISARSGPTKRRRTLMTRFALTTFRVAVISPRHCKGRDALILRAILHPRCWCQIPLISLVRLSHWTLYLYATEDKSV